MGRSVRKNSSKKGLSASASQGSAMGRSVRKNSSKKGTSASASQPKISSQELGDRFAKMSLRPTYQNDAKKKDKSIAKASGSHQVKNNREDAILFILYKYVKEAVEVMKRPEWPDGDDLNGREAKLELKAAEYKIGLVCRVYIHYLPLGWKYERENASSLIAGYHKTFIGEDGLKFIM